VFFFSLKLVPIKIIMRVSNCRTSLATGSLLAVFSPFYSSLLNWAIIETDFNQNDQRSLIVVVVSLFTVYYLEIFQSKRTLIAHCRCC